MSDHAQNTHGELAALRGNPSFVWRDGQERRYQMVAEHVPVRGKRILDVGCGHGLYTRAFMRNSTHVFGIELELARARLAREYAKGIAQSVGEYLPFEDQSFDLVFSHEVLEHVQDDRLCAAEMTRITQCGGHIAVFVPNRLYPFETHGIYWRGTYRFGNKPFVNWLPNPLRDKLAPHVRAYTGHSLRALFNPEITQVVYHGVIYPGYDNIIARFGRMGKILQSITYAFERTPLRHFGLSHLLVLEVNRKLSE